MDLNASYRACAHVTRQEARNFYYAFLTLPRTQRLAVYALYAFCREADDIVDGAGPVERKRNALGYLRRRLRGAADGQTVSPSDLALSDTIGRFGVDPGDLEDVLTGMELDLTLRRIQTAEELDRYGYYAASAVGLATLPVLNQGIPPTDTMRQAAIDLGLGMQYVNVLRDVPEDLRRDRIYLPKERLEFHGVRLEDLKAGRRTEAVQRLFADHGDRAAGFLDRGRRLIPSLPRGGRRCVWLLAEIYGRVLDRIEQADGDVFTGRVSLSAREKVRLVVESLWRARG